MIEIVGLTSRREDSFFPATHGFLILRMMMMMMVWSSVVETSLEKESQIFLHPRQVWKVERVLNWMMEQLVSLVWLVWQVVLAAEVWRDWICWWSSWRILPDHGPSWWWWRQHQDQATPSCWARVVNCGRAETQLLQLIVHSVLGECCCTAAAVVTAVVRLAVQ